LGEDLPICQSTNILPIPDLWLRLLISDADLPTVALLRSRGIGIFKLVVINNVEEVLFILNVNLEC